MTEPLTIPSPSYQPDPIECDVCRQELSVGAPFHRLSFGMDEAPSYAGLPPEAESAVESTHELIVCGGCEPAVTRLFDGLLETLWNLRETDERLRERNAAGKEAQTCRT